MMVDISYNKPSGSFVLLQQTHGGKPPLTGTFKQSLPVWIDMNHQVSLNRWKKKKKKQKSYNMSTACGRDD